MVGRWLRIAASVRSGSKPGSTTLVAPTAWNGSTCEPKAIR
ncbi:MAG: hypothetical protein U1E35_01950 [Rhodospirillales bacterium]